MSKWCDTCYRNETTGEWEPCDESCPVFGRYFGELAHHVISHENRALDKVADLENKIKWLVRLVADLCIDLNYTDEEFVEVLENCCFTKDDFRRYAGINLFKERKRIMPYKSSDEAVSYLKKRYPVGTRIQLDCMGDDPRPIESGTKGTVRVVDDMGTVHCDFDNGRRMGLILGEDSFHIITDEE